MATTPPRERRRGRLIRVIEEGTDDTSMEATPSPAENVVNQVTRDIQEESLRNSLRAVAAPDTIPTQYEQERVRQEMQQRVEERIAQQHQLNVQHEDTTLSHETVTMTSGNSRAIPGNWWGTDLSPEPTPPEPSQVEVLEERVVVLERVAIESLLFLRDAMRGINRIEMNARQPELPGDPIDIEDQLMQRSAQEEHRLRDSEREIYDGIRRLIDLIRHPSERGR